jgi:hypothetical protein
LQGSCIRISEYERLPAIERNTTTNEKAIPFFPTQVNSFSFFLKRIENMRTRQITCPATVSDARDVVRKVAKVIQNEYLKY